MGQIRPVGCRLPMHALEYSISIGISRLVHQKHFDNGEWQLCSSLSLLIIQSIFQSGLMEKQHGNTEESHKYQKIVFSI